MRYTSEVIAWICLLLAFVAMSRCEVAQTRETEQTRRLYIERGYCQDKWQTWAPCQK